jgi:hypothetical protein
VENNGWVKIHRRLLKNAITNKPDYFSLWIHLLLMANHEPTSFIWNNKKQTLNSGQLLTGRKVLSRETGITESQVYKILEYLEKEQQIEQQKTTKYTVITIVKWDTYQKKEQQKEQQSNNRGTTERQQSNTYENVKKDKNDKNIISKDITRHGREDINECISFLEDQLGSPLDESQQMNRRYCKLLLDKYCKSYPTRNPVETVKALIGAGIQDQWHGKHLTSFKYLYYNAGKIILSRRQQINSAIRL